MDANRSVNQEFAKLMKSKAEELNIQCFNSAAGNANAVSEHVLGMLLYLFKNIHKSWINTTDIWIQRSIWIFKMRIRINNKLKKYKKRYQVFIYYFRISNWK